MDETGRDSRTLCFVPVYTGKDIESTRTATGHIMRARGLKLQLVHGDSTTGSWSKWSAVFCDRV